MTTGLSGLAIVVLLALVVLPFVIGVFVVIGIVLARSARDSRDR